MWAPQYWTTRYWTASYFPPGIDEEAAVQSLGNLGWAPPQKAPTRDRRLRDEERERREALRTEIIALFREAVKAPLPEEAVERIAQAVAPTALRVVGELPPVSSIDFTGVLSNLDALEEAVELLRQVVAERHREEREEEELIQILMMVA